MSKVPARWLCVGNRPHWPSISATGCRDRAAERQAGDLGRRRCRADSEDVVAWSGSSAMTVDDDLELVAADLETTGAAGGR